MVAHHTRAEPPPLSSKRQTLTLHSVTFSETKEGTRDNGSPLQAPSSPLSSWAAACFDASGTISDRNIESLLREAADANRDDFGAASAIEWAAGYSFPKECIAGDFKCLQAAGRDFTAMIRRRLKILSIDRLSEDRVNGLLPDNPERRLMFDLVDGMRVHLPLDFTPNGNLDPSPLRSTYVEVHAAVNRMLGDIVQQRLAFLIPLATARQHVPRLHLGKAHWTRKKGKPSGRPLSDLTFVDGTPLNTPETAEAASSYYGKIMHPTIEDIAMMVNTFWLKAQQVNPNVQWADLRLWKRTPPIFPARRRWALRDALDRRPRLFPVGWHFRVGGNTRRFPSGHPRYILGAAASTPEFHTHVRR